VNGSGEVEYGRHKSASCTSHIYAAPAREEALTERNRLAALRENCWFALNSDRVLAVAAKTTYRT